jgi:hypothetical protein
MSAAFAHSLYDCVAEIDLIESTLEAIDAEDLSPELRAELEHELNAAIAGTREKIDRTASVLAAFEAAELAAAAEMKRLAARKDRMERQRERLEGYVISVLAGAGVKKLDGFTSTLTARANPVSVVIDVAAVLPAEFLRCRSRSRRIRRRTRGRSRPRSDVESSYRVAGWRRRCGWCGRETPQMGCDPLVPGGPGWGRRNFGRPQVSR